MAKSNTQNSAQGENRPSLRDRASGNPAAVLAGGFAVGAVLGAVLPSTSRERRALQPVGEKINEAAKGAARQAAETGRDKLNKLTGEVVTQVGSKVIDAVAPATESSNA
jgi:hypothetical protein